MTDEAAFLKIPERNVKMEPEVTGCFTSLVSMSLRTSNEDDSDLIVGTSENFGIFNVGSNQIQKNVKDQQMQCKWCNKTFWGTVNMRVRMYVCIWYVDEIICMIVNIGSKDCKQLLVAIR